jgi:hypothetical protein
LSLEAKTALADSGLPPALTLLTRQNTCLSDLRPRIMTDKRPRPVPCIYLRFIRLHVPALGSRVGTRPIPSFATVLGCSRRPTEFLRHYTPLQSLYIIHPIIHPYTPLQLDTPLHGVSIYTPTVGYTPMDTPLHGGPYSALLSHIELQHKDFKICRDCAMV